MSDLVVVEETGSTVVIQEVSAGNIVEVVAAGPQGAQGVQGNKGDTGDVTPAALAAKAAAETAATAAAGSATSAGTSATAAASSATSAASSATTATTKASEASTSATNAAASATSAGASATTATTKASEASTSATNAAGSAATASTKATEAAASASGAATSASSASTSASTATTKASDAAASASAAATSATSAANSATSATNSANSATSSAASATSSATAAAGSASTASTKASEASASAATASTKAGEASTSAANAAGSATSASTSASTATTKASEAATSASSASTSATSAGTSATSAASSATAAQTARTGAEAAYDAFDDRYLGSKTSFPTVDNDGNALLDGALFYHTAVTPKQIYIWNGAAWDPAAFSASGAVVSFNTRSGAVTLTGSDVVGALSYTPVNAASLAAVATSGAYADLTGKPTALSAFTNDAGFITSSALSPYLTSSAAASTYQTLSGMSSYLTTASAASTYLPLAGGTLTGNLTFGGTNQLITGDFTSATRIRLQTSTANGNTFLGVVPNGTATNAQLQVFGASDVNNAPFGTLTINSGTLQLQSAAVGTGTLLPLRIMMASTEVLRVSTASNILIGTSTDDGSNKLQVTGNTALTGNLTFAGTSNRITGDFSNATVASRAAFQSSTVNGNTLVNLLPNGTATVARWGAFNGSDPANASVISIGVTTSAAEIVSTFNGTGAALPLDFYVGGAKQLSIATSGAATFTAAVSGPTAAVDTNTTQLATTAYVMGQGYLKSATAASTYQTTLVSGINIKTINGSSILGSGNITVAGSSGLSLAEVQAAILSL